MKKVFIWHKAIAIKMAPVIKVFKKMMHFKTYVAVTAQHRVK